jgi:hypothetical protein
LEVFANQNKQLVEEYRTMSDELASFQDQLTVSQKQVAVYEGKRQEINLLTLTELEEYEKTIKNTLHILEERKVSYRVSVNSRLLSFL